MQAHGFNIRVSAFHDIGRPLLGPGMGLDLSALRERGPRNGRLVIFEVSGYGVRQYIGIPAVGADEDALITDGRAKLRAMLAALAQLSEKWQAAPPAGPGTP